MSVFVFLLPMHSGSIISGLGRAVVHHGAQGALRIQRESLHLDGDLQRISAHLLPQRVHVSCVPDLAYTPYIYI